MKKKLFLLICLFLPYIVSSLELTRLINEINAGETFIGYFEADIKSKISKDNLKIYEERREVFFEKDIYVYKNITFIYVIFPKRGNFSLIIDGFFYKDNNSLKEGKINETIFVKENSTKILGISPGFIIGERLGFSISNKGKEEITIRFQNKSYDLKENESRVVYVNPEKEFFYLELESYKSFKIPVVCFSFQNTSINETLNKTQNKGINETNLSEKENKKIEINERIIERYFEINKTSEVFFSIKNNFDSEVNVSLKSKLENLNFTKNETIYPSEERNFSLIYSPNKTGNFEENLSIIYENETINITLKFFVITSESFSISEEIRGREQNISSCEQIKGVLCVQTGYTCRDGNNVPIIGVGFCCVGGKCEKIKEENSKKPISKYIIGIFSLIIVGIISFIAYKRFKSAKAEGHSFKK